MNSSPCNNYKNTAEESNMNKKRFKGVENFLRRVAYNLGNSPSETEVKIVSCIPIDVTDLQNKIISLERQLNEAKNCIGPTNPTSVNTALVEQSNAGGCTSEILSCKCSGVNLDLGETRRMHTQGDQSSGRRKSIVSVMFPSVGATGSHKTQSIVLDENWTEESNHDNIRHKSIFRKCKKEKSSKKKEKPKTQLVYYAHTENSPFKRYNNMSSDNQFADREKTDVDNVLSHAYLASVFERHFNPERVVEEFSDTSHFTSPVCRDFENGGRCRYESDVCSCCHGQFQNIDNYIGKNQNFIVDPITISLHEGCKRNSYYDSKLYDIVPVKEKPVKILKDQKPKKDKEHRTNTRSHSTLPHNQNATPAQYYNCTNNKTYRQEPRNTIGKKSPQRSSGKKVDKLTGPTDTSKSCCVDCSEVYARPRRTERPGPEQMRPVFRKNAECLTIDVGAKKLTITRSIQIDIGGTEENRTEETLNQIKGILQSVLAEVKTNPQMNNLPEVISKKDAVVQNGTSESNVNAHSALLHSYTYKNSYNNNPYLASCSHQAPSNVQYTNISPLHNFKCSQNFPLLIQTPGHPTCGCFYKNYSHASRSIRKQAAATTTATNTERDDDTPGTETDKLIKEIYKSIALTLEYPKDTSISEYDDLKSVTNNSVPRDNRMTEELRRDTQVDVSMTPMSTTTVSKYTSSVGIGPDIERKEVHPYLNYESQSTETETEEMKLLNGITKVASTISEHYTEEVCTDSESEKEAIVETTNVKAKTEKKGLLKRMLGSVFNKRKVNNSNEKTKQSLENNSDAQSQSDSEDYETIYSEKTYKAEHNSPRQQQYKPIKYSTYRPTQQRARMNRRSPYMEQEYRRQWNEQLMFQENRGRRYSSERPYSVQQAPVYWQDYEARSAVLDRSPTLAYYERNPIDTANSVEKRTSTFNIDENQVNARSKLSWLRKKKQGLTQCGEQWKKFVLEN